MIWREWKAEIERLGVKDDDKVEYIDVHGGELKVETQADGSKAIWS